MSLQSLGKSVFDPLPSNKQQILAQNAPFLGCFIQSIALTRCDSDTRRFSKTQRWLSFKLKVVFFSKNDFILHKTPCKISI